MNRRWRPDGGNYVVLDLYLAIALLFLVARAMLLSCTRGWCSAHPSIQRPRMLHSLLNRKRDG